MLVYVGLNGSSLSQEAVLDTFASAVALDDQSFFGQEQQRSTRQLKEEKFASGIALKLLVAWWLDDVKGHSDSRWNMLGAVLANRGFPEKAIKVWQQALQPLGRTCPGEDGIGVWWHPWTMYLMQCLETSIPCYPRFFAFILTCRQTSYNKTFRAAADAT